MERFAILDVWQGSKCTSGSQQNHNAKYLRKYLEISYSYKFEQHELSEKLVTVYHFLNSKNDPK